MSEKYQRLFSLEKNLYKEGACVIVLAGAILKDTVNNNVLAQLKFKNIGTKPIKALKVSLRLYDTAGHDLESVTEFQYLDLSICRNGEFGEQTPILLSNSYARSMSVSVVETVFSDGEVWEDDGDWESIGVLDNNAKTVNDLKAVFGEGAKYVPVITKDLWFCTCGAINRQEEDGCCECKAYKSALFECLSEDIRKKYVIYTTACHSMRQNNIDEVNKALILFENLNDWKDSKEKADQCRDNIVRINNKIAKLENERKLKKQEQERAEKDKKKKKKKCAIVCFLIGVLIAVACLVEYKFLPESQFNKAEQLLREGNYVEAEAIFSHIRHIDCDEKLQECEYEKLYQEACALYEQGQYEKAEAEFRKAISYKDSKDQVEKCKESILARNYEDAKALYNNGEYSQAQIGFEAIKNYKDSAEWLAKCDNVIKSEKYAVALGLFEEGKYEEALEAFTEIIDFGESEVKAKECEEIICEEKYNRAMKHAEDNEFSYAYALLDSIPEYKDSKQKAAEFRIINRCKNVSVNGEVSFGNYYNDSKSKISKDSIVWKVLEKKDGELLLISKMIIDAGVYNEEDGVITWEQSDIREWLNKEFYNKAFSEIEKKFIQLSYVKNNDYVLYNNRRTDCGNDTYDKVYLLAYDEVDKYFDSDFKKVAAPTDYAKGKLINGTSERNPRNDRWMLRTVYDEKRVCAIGVDGDFDTVEIGDRETVIFKELYDEGCGYGVRPVIRIKYGE